jgi:hypothetical protein
MAIAIPPILMIIIFKIYMNRKFNKNFYYYLPNEEELRTAQVHSTRSDTVKQKLQLRFGHPSLHAELFTPMVHADQMHLLRQVYAGKIEETEEGKTKDANVQVLGGLRIAAIQQVILNDCSCHTMLTRAIVERPPVRPGYVQSRPGRVRLRQKFIGFFDDAQPSAFAVQAESCSASLPFIRATIVPWLRYRQRNVKPPEHCLVAA